MARPRKQTVEYFPHACTHKKTIFILEQKFNNDGYAFWFKLLELLGVSNGHYIDLKDKANWEFLLAKARVSDNTCTEILDLLADLDAIDKELWTDHKVVWSQNFVDGLDTVYQKRRAEKPTKPSFRHENPITNNQTVEKTPQSKVEESKVEKSREYYTREIEKFRQRYDAETLRLVDQFFDILRTTRVSGKLNDGTILKVYEKMDKHSPIVVKYACSTVVGRPDLHSKKEDYFFGIMRNTTADEATKKLNQDKGYHGGPQYAEL